MLRAFIPLVIIGIIIAAAIAANQSYVAPNSGDATSSQAGDGQRGGRACGSPAGSPRTADSRAYP